MLCLYWIRLARSWPTMAILHQHWLTTLAEFAPKFLRAALGHRTDLCRTRPDSVNIGKFWLTWAKTCHHRPSLVRRHLKRHRTCAEMSKNETLNPLNFAEHLWAAVSMLSRQSKLPSSPLNFGHSASDSASCPNSGISGWTFVCRTQPKFDATRSTRRRLKLAACRIRAHLDRACLTCPGHDANSAECDPTLAEIRPKLAELKYKVAEPGRLLIQFKPILVEVRATCDRIRPNIVLGKAGLRGPKPTGRYEGNSGFLRRKSTHGTTVTRDHKATLAPQPFLTANHFEHARKVRRSRTELHACQRRLWSSSKRDI